MSLIGCFGKIAYPTRAKAVKVAARLYARPGYIIASRRDTDKLHAYRCKHCDGFHLGREKRSGRTQFTKARTDPKAAMARYRELTK